MSIEVLVTVSCILTAVTMLIFSTFLFILIQFGGRGVQALFNRFFGGNKGKDPEQDAREPARPRRQVASSEVLRQRAQQLDFAPQVAAQGFNAQATPQQASFTSRDPLNPPQANPNYGQQQQAQYGQSTPSMPSLSSARPFQSGQPLGGQTQYGQQPLGGQQQEYGQYNQQPLGGQQPGQYGQQRPSGQSQYGQQHGQFGQQQYGQQSPGGQQQGQYGQQQQQSPLGQYNPPLRGVNVNQNTAPGLRRRRDGRRGDDRDTIYDDSDGGGLDGIIGEVGDFLG